MRTDAVEGREDEVREVSSGLLGNRGTGRVTSSAPGAPVGGLCSPSGPPAV